ncbi:site-specific DNA-methyltransferase [Patescibacteria group bacterium]|nr:site-specific DNA-methyltransferase [Candidatus Falkowbacteria bacterium]MBU4073194.1 site-specific DNA-methyltransferase [Patescibacteria group bacterium]MBU4125858.1 site-specific DNA-methyltransferase [Patescibacteria group bacterium]
MAKNNKYANYSREELIDELETLKKKKYGLVWDKKNSQEILDAFVNWENVPENFMPKQFPVLKEVKNKEIETDRSKPTNLLIEGDNYHSLAVLNFTHQNKIDVIYIDPPYNTGNKDFIFNDTFFDKKGPKFVDKEDPWRHSKWLSFMEKRLRLAKNLLKKSGVIFISINDIELAQLKMLCNEIFDENNFIGTLIWRKKEGGGQADAYFATEHEYILVYAKSDSFKWLDEEIPVEEAGFNKEDKNGKFTAVKLAKWGNTAKREDRPKMYFSIKSPDGSNIYPIAPDGGDGRWRVGKKRMDMIIDKNLIYWQEKEKKWVPYEKIYFNEGELKKIKERSILFDLATTADGTNELTHIFGEKDIFQNPKPTELIKFFLMYGAKSDAIVLDFFAGSGTTAQAVLSLNKEDKGNRKFILCTNDEELDNNGNSTKHKICTDVCYPRIKKIINGYKNSKGENISSLGGNLKYFKTDFVGSDSTDKNKRDLVNKSVEMICIKEDIFDLIVDEGFDFKIYQKGKRFLGVIFELGAIADFKKEAEKHKGNFVIYCFSYNEVAPEEKFNDMKNKYVLKPIPAVILRIYLEIFKK